MMYRVHYMRPEWFRDGIFGREPDANALDKTHISLRNVRVRFPTTKPLEEVFRFMQGEVWSPNGEARELILAKGLQHTSMSVGDIMIDETDRIFLVGMVGFKMWDNKEWVEVDSAGRKLR